MSPPHSASGRRSLFLLVLSLLLCVLLPAPAQASDREALARIKLAYLYNFIKFTYWPSDLTAGFRLCIADDPALAALAEQQIAGRKLRGQPVVVVAVAASDAAEGCQLLYSEHGEHPRTDAGVLTVGEGRDFVEQGGMIGFVVVQDRVRFYIRLDALRQARLRADAQLLTAALEVLK
ncbi:MAG: YfiR family protein [Stagnimonas sp.]|nr:YfiR family protein [Stagnimonas sp.]